MVCLEPSIMPLLLGLNGKLSLMVTTDTSHLVFVSVSHLILLERRETVTEMSEVREQHRVWDQRHFLWGQEVERKTTQEVTVVPSPLHSWVWPQFLTCVEKSKPSASFQNLVTRTGSHLQAESIYIMLLYYRNEKKGTCWWSYITTLMRAMLRLNYRPTPSGFIDLTVWVNHQR